MGVGSLKRGAVRRLPSLWTDVEALARLALSDRIAVLYEGEILGVFPCAGADMDRIGLMMGGVRESSAGRSA